MSTVALHKGKLAKSISHKEILDFILHNRALGNAAASNEIIYKLWSIGERYQEKSWSILQNDDIVLCIDIFLHLEESLMLHKNFKIFLIKYKNLFS